jgi:hypothetical protein
MAWYPPTVKFELLGLVSVVLACSSEGAVAGADDGTVSAPGGSKPAIRLGVPVSGTVDASDISWYVLGPPPASGYQDSYQFDTTAGTKYTVTCTGEFADVSDDDEVGDIIQANGESGFGVDCPRTPATWTPQRTGATTINIVALWEDVPVPYTVTFSK